MASDTGVDIKPETSVAERFICFTCQKEFPTANDREYHQRQVHQRTAHIVMEDSRTFTLMRHADNKFHCPHPPCTLRTTNVSNLRRHVMRHPSSSKRRFSPIIDTVSVIQTPDENGNIITRFFHPTTPQAICFSAIEAAAAAGITSALRQATPPGPRRKRRGTHQRGRPSSQTSHSGQQSGTEDPDDDTEDADMAHESDGPGESKPKVAKISDSDAALALASMGQRREAPAAPPAPPASTSVPAGHVSIQPSSLPSQAMHVAGWPMPSMYMSSSHPQALPQQYDGAKQLTSQSQPSHLPPQKASSSLSAAHSAAQPGPRAASLIQISPTAALAYRQQAGPHVSSSTLAPTPLNEILDGADSGKGLPFDEQWSRHGYMDKPIEAVLGITSAAEAVELARCASSPSLLPLVSRLLTQFDALLDENLIFAEYCVASLDYPASPASLSGRQPLRRVTGVEFEHSVKVVTSFVQFIGALVGQDPVKLQSPSSDGIRTSVKRLRLSLSPDLQRAADHFFASLPDSSDPRANDQTALSALRELLTKLFLYRPHLCDRHEDNPLWRFFALRFAKSATLVAKPTDMLADAEALLHTSHTVVLNHILSQRLDLASFQDQFPRDPFNSCAILTVERDRLQDFTKAKRLLVGHK